MSFVRDGAAATLRRWREVLSGLGLAALGLWWATSTGALVAWIGWVALLIGLALILAGIQRGRFRIPGQGPGVVQVDEGRIAYFGPLTGGAVALSELRRVSHDPTGKPAHWVLSQPGQEDLFIPVTAEGAEALFDIFASLPGLQTERMLASARRRSGQPEVIWEHAQGRRTLEARS